MVKVTYVQPDGAEITVEAREGDSVMSAAIANDVEGIVAECGGSMMCATCHCYVEADWADRTGARMEGEDDMLDCAVSEVTETSRLSCQIRLTAELDGLRVRLPEAQA